MKNIDEKKSGDCDRCGKNIGVNDYVPLNAIPRDKNFSVPFQLKIATWWRMRECILCKDCVQSFFDWWKEGNSE